MSSDETVGYAKPPKKTQFQKGQSGCPDGGHEQRRANKEKREAEARRAEKAKEARLKVLISQIAREEHEVTTRNGRALMSKIEITLRNVFDRANKPDARDRDVALAIQLYKLAKLLDPATSAPRNAVLVVERIKTIEQWEKDTEGELLPRNPLHGVPGAEDFLDRPIQDRSSLVPDEDD